MSRSSNWDRVAAQAAERIGDELIEAHRGVMQSHHANVFAAFGNDGYEIDERSKGEVEAARKCIEAGGGTVLGFGVCPDGYSWALLYLADNLTPEKVTEALWAAWLGDRSADEETSFFRTQSEVADNAILEDMLSRLPKDIINPN